MTEPGPVGRRLPGLGRARRLPRAPAAAREPGPGAPRARRASCGALSQRVVPVRRPPHRGAVPHGPPHRVRPPASARRWSRSARWPPGSRTRSTTRPRRRPARSTRCRTRTEHAAVARCAGSPSTRHHRRAVRRARRAAPRARRGAGRRSTRSPLADREDDAVGLARRPRRRPRLGASPRRSPPPAPTSAWCERVGRRRSQRDPLEPGAGVGRQLAVDRARCSPRSRSRPARISDARRGGAVLLAARPRARCRRTDVTEGLESTLVMLGHKLRRRHHRRARLRRRPAADRGDRRRAQPGVDQPHRQRRRRDGRRAARCASRPAPTSRRRRRRDRRHRPGHAARGRRPTRSSRSSRPRTSARAPASASTSPAASSSSATAARSPSSPPRAHGGPGPAARPRARLTRSPGGVPVGTSSVTGVAGSAAGRRAGRRPARRTAPARCRPGRRRTPPGRRARCPGGPRTPRRGAGGRPRAGGSGSASGRRGRPAAARGAKPRSSRIAATCSRADVGEVAAAPRRRARSWPHSSPARRASAWGSGLVRAITDARAAARPAYSEVPGPAEVLSYSHAGRPRPSGSARDRATSRRPTRVSRCSRTVLGCSPVIWTSAAWVSGPDRPRSVSRIASGDGESGRRATPDRGPSGRVGEDLRPRCFPRLRVY